MFAGVGGGGWGLRGGVWAGVIGVGGWDDNGRGRGEGRKPVTSQCWRRARLGAREANSARGRECFVWPPAGAMCVPVSNPMVA